LVLLRFAAWPVRVACLTGVAFIFGEEVHAPKQLITLGYTAFMAMMAI